MNLDRILAVRNDKTVYRDGNLCLQVFNSDFSKADVLNEALNQARIEETGLNIPKIHEVTVIEGKWTIVYDYISGKTLAQLMEEHPEKKEEYLELLVNLQLEMHSKTCPLLNKLKDKMSRKISQTDLSATVRYDLHTRLEAMPKHVKLCHGDFSPENIIINDEGVFIVDWLKAKQGNASADIAKTYLTFCLNHHTEWAEKYLKLYCAKTGTAMKYVQEWLPIVAAAQLKFKRPEERSLLGLPHVRPQ